MEYEAGQRLLDAYRACEHIMLFIGQHTLSDYNANLILQAAVERKFEIVGEALRRAEVADESVADTVPDLRRIVGLRNRIIHGYDTVDNELIWQITQVNVPELIKQLKAVLEITD